MEVRGDKARCNYQRIRCVISDVINTTTYTAHSCRVELSVSVETVAKMEIGLRRAAEGVLLTVMAGCGTLLFALMSAEVPDEKLVSVMTFVGLVAGSLCFVSEIWTVTKAWTRSRANRNHLEQPVAMTSEELVDGCSWHYVIASFIVTAVYTALCSIYAANTAKWALETSDMILPVAGVCWVLAVMLRPKDEGRGIYIVHLQVSMGGAINCR